MRIFCALFLALAIVAAQVLHGGLLWPVFLVPSSIFLIVAGVSALFVVVRNRTPIAPLVLIGASIFVGYIIWRCAHASDRYFGRVELGQALAGALAFFAAGCGLGNARSKLVFVGIVVAAAGGQAVLGLLQFAFGEHFAPLGWFANDLQVEYTGRFVTRAHGFFINPNHFAWLMNWAALMSVAMACWGRGRVVVRVVLIYLALLFVVAGVFSGSRGGALGLIGGLATFGFGSVLAIVTAMRRGRLLVTLGAIGVFALCGGAVFAVYSTNWVAQARIDSLQNMDVREYFLEHAWRQFQTSPLVGSGPGEFRYAARAYRTDNFTGDAIFAHDDWLQTLVEYGFIGLAIAGVTTLLLLGGGLKSFLFTIRARGLSGDHPLSNSGAISLGALSAAVAFCIHSFTDFNMHIPANAILAGATLGLLSGIAPEEQEFGSRLQLGILRGSGLLATACLTIALTLFVSRHGLADYQSLLAANALAEGNVKVALEHADRGLKLQPEDAALLATKGRSLYAYESWIGFEEERFLEEKGAKTGSSPRIAEFTPEQRRKVYEDSFAVFAAAARQQPKERNHHVDLGKALLELGESQRAQKEFLTAIRLDPGSDYTYGVLGDYFYDSDRPRLALQIYSIAAPLKAGGYCSTRAQDLREELSLRPGE